MTLSDRLLGVKTTNVGTCASKTDITPAPFQPRWFGMVLHERRSTDQQLNFEGTMFEQNVDRNRCKDDYENEQEKSGISEFEAAASIAKAIMGAGSFALPWAFSKMGYIAGPIIMFVFMLFSINSLDLLVQSSRMTSVRYTSTTNATTTGLSVECRPKKSSTTASSPQIQSYVDVARSVFGQTGARLTYVASISASMGVCGSYLLFIAANLQSLFLSDKQESGLSQANIIVLILPVVVALSSVRDTKAFAFASCLGVVSVLLGMLVVLVYGLLYNSQNFGKDCIAFGSITTMPLAIGAIGYLFLIHFLSLPIESAMVQPERFQSVAKKTFGACGVVSGIFGVIGYLLFGNETQQIVLLNVQGSIFVSAVNLLLCIDLLLTYPVVMRPSIVIVEQSLSTITSLPKTAASKTSALSVTWSVHITTCALFGICAAMASIFVPTFGLLSGLVGGVSQTFLAFVLPPLMFARQHHASTNIVDFVKRMDSRGKVLVLSGIVLILWTAASTRNELS